MLKLEKSARSETVSIRLRHDGRKLNPIFLQALTAAMGLHLFFIIIFHIQPFRLPKVTTIFPPVEVNIITTPDIDQGTMANLDETSPVTHPIPPPAETSPQLPNIYQQHLSHQAAYPSASFNPKRSFHTLAANDTIIENLFLDPLKPGNPSPSVIINISGPISSKPYTTPIVNKIDSILKKIRAHEEISAKYEITVDDRLGAICACHPINQPNKKKEQRWIRQIVDEISFSPINDGLITMGVIEIQLTGKGN